MLETRIAKERRRRPTKEGVRRAICPRATPKDTSS